MDKQLAKGGAAMLSDFQKKVILTVIIKAEDQIRANGMPVKTQARQWAKLAYWQGKIGDQAQQQLALTKALELDPNNALAKKLRTETK
jgi:Tfp pilus assembly protein PilF